MHRACLGEVTMGARALQGEVKVLAFRGKEDVASLGHGSCWREHGQALTFVGTSCDSQFCLRVKCSSEKW